MFRFTLSVWLYIREYCPHQAYCSVLHRINPEEELLSPMIYITRYGNTPAIAHFLKSDDLVLREAGLRQVTCIVRERQLRLYGHVA